MSQLSAPRIIQMSSIGSSQLGYITVAEPPRDVPFDIKRVYWTYYTPHNVVRGNHAHKELEQLLVAAHGTLEVELEDLKGNKSQYKLENPSIGLLIPKLHWRNLRFSHSAVLLCMASAPYDEADYIRNYADFRRLRGET